MIGWRVYDAMRSLDYLSTRPEIDMNRIGVMASPAAAQRPSTQQHWMNGSRLRSSAAISIPSAIVF